MGHVYDGAIKALHQSKTLKRLLTHMSHAADSRHFLTWRQFPQLLMSRHAHCRDVPSPERCCICRSTSSATATLSMRCQI